MLSGSFGLSGSGHYEVDAVREDSYAEKIAGEAREFRHAPSPLQVEVNTVLQGDDDRAGPDRADRARRLHASTTRSSATPPRRRPPAW